VPWRPSNNIVHVIEACRCHRFDVQYMCKPLTRSTLLLRDSSLLVIWSALSYGKWIHARATLRRRLPGSNRRIATLSHCARPRIVCCWTSTQISISWHVAPTSILITGVAIRQRREIPSRSTPTQSGRRAQETPKTHHSAARQRGHALQPTNNTHLSVLH
jgi:hypothetical protein